MNCSSSVITLVTIEKLTQKHIRRILSDTKFKSLKAKDYKYRIKHERFQGTLSDEQWGKIFLIPRIAPVDNRTKDLQYKILIRFAPTNYLLFKMKKITYQTCTFCMMEPETIEHLFFNCIHVKNIWLCVFNEWQMMRRSCVKVL